MSNHRVPVTSQLFIPTEITWEVALRAAYVLNDSFASDFFREEYWPDKYDFSKLLPLPGFKNLRKLPWAFQAAVNHTARRYFFEAQTNPRFCLILGQNAGTGEDVALAIMFLPWYAPPFRLGDGNTGEPGKWVSKVVGKIASLTPIKLVAQTFKNMCNVVWPPILGYMFKVWEVWDTQTLSSPFSPAAMRASFAFGEKACHGLATPERLSQLKSMSREELEDTVYPRSWAYKMGSFAVLTSYQGQGVGSQFIKQVVSGLKGATAIQSPPGINGPAKMEFFSSLPGAPFYERAGFRLGASQDDTQPSGRVFTHRFYFMNLE